MEKLSKAEKRTRDRKDSGFTDESSPDAKSPRESVFFSHEEGEAPPNRDQEVKCLTARQYRVFVEEVNHDGPRQFILEDTSTKSHRRGVFYPDEPIDEREELFHQERKNMNSNEHTILMNEFKEEGDGVAEKGTNDKEGNEGEMETGRETRSRTAASTGAARRASICGAEKGKNMKTRSFETSNPIPGNRPGYSVSETSCTPLISNDPEHDISRCSKSTTKMRICAAASFLFALILAVALCIVSFGPATNDGITMIERESSIPVKCSPKCSDILQSTSVSNGRLECFGEMLYVSCKTHFDLIGKDSFGCNTTNVTTDSFVCSPKQCPLPPQLLDGDIACNTSLTIGHSCRVRCLHGLVEGEEDQVTCQEDLSWSRLPSCLPPPCTSWNSSQDKILCSDSGQHCMARCGEDKLTQVRFHPLSFNSV